MENSFYNSINKGIENSLNRLMETGRVKEVLTVKITVEAQFDTEQSEQDIRYRVLTLMEYGAYEHGVASEDIGKVFTEKDEAYLFAARSAKSEKKDFFIQNIEGDTVVSVTRINFKDINEINKIINKYQKQ